MWQFAGSQMEMATSENIPDQIQERDAGRHKEHVSVTL